MGVTLYISVGVGVKSTIADGIQMEVLINYTERVTGNTTPLNIMLGLP